MSLAVSVAQPQPVPPANVAVATIRDRSLADMRGFLDRVKPQSAAESLRLLRNAYPDAPLSLRVEACGL